MFINQALVVVEKLHKITWWGQGAAEIRHSRVSDNAKEHHIP